MSEVEKDVDVLVVGGGLIGIALMLALQHSGLRCLLVDAKMHATSKDTALDARSLALSPASVAILKMLHVWSLIEHHSTPIEQIHISQQGCFGQARLHARSLPLGYLIDIFDLYAALLARLDTDKLWAPGELTMWDSPSKTATILYHNTLRRVRAQVVVAADGTHSKLRQWCGLHADVRPYAELALVTNIELARSHQNIAYERFTTYGPLALLPLMKKRAALVWSVPASDAQRLLHATEQDFLRELQRAFGYRLGRFMHAGQRVIYPLQQVTMPQLVKNQVVFIGNAANTLHPVAGQGFNLGLRDVAMLAQCLVHHGMEADALQHYQTMRQDDHKLIRRFTGSLLHVFMAPYPGAGLMRGLGLLAFDNLPFLKKMLSRYAGGYAGVIPDLVCGLDLVESA